MDEVGTGQAAAEEGAFDAESRRLLILGPPGSGKTHAALAMIRSATTVAGERGRATHTTPEALLLLPTYAQVLHLKRVALARWGARGILDAPFTTFTAAGERFLDDFRVADLPSADERDALMEAALERAAVPTFERIADRPGFRSRLLRLVKEVKQSGRTPTEISERLEHGLSDLGPGGQERLAGFLRVYAVYEELLRATGFEDHEDLLRRLLVALETTTPRATPSLLVVDGFEDFTPVEELILLRLADRVLDAGGRVRLTLPHDPARPELFAASESVRQRWRRHGYEQHTLTGFARSPETGLEALATRLFAGGGGAPPAGVEVLVGGDEADEADAIARHALALRDGARPGGAEEGLIRGWRDIGIVMRRLDGRATRIESAFETLGIPLRVVGSLHRLAAEPLVRALREPLQVLAGHGRAGRGHSGQIEGRRLSAWLRYVAHATGDEALLQQVDELALKHRTEGEVADFETYVADAPERAAPWLVRLREQAQALAGSESAYTQLGIAIRALAPVAAASGLAPDGRPRDRAADRAHAKSVLARRRVLESIEALARAEKRMGVGPAQPAAIIEALFDALERGRMGLPDRRLDAVHLMDAEEARFWELPVVYVAGLEEGRFPLRPREDVLLRDHEREQLAALDDGLRLPLSRDRETRERRLFHVAVTRARTRLILCRAAYDVNGDLRPPSFFWRDVRRSIQLPPDPAPPEPGNVVPRSVVTPADLGLRAAAALADADTDDAARLAAFATLEAVQAGVLRRAALDVRPAGTPLWAEAGAAQAEAIARFSKRAERISVSRINRALRCPHQYFLAEVVRLPQDDASFESRGLDPRAVGSILHDAAQLALAEGELAPAEIAAHVVPTLATDAVLGMRMREEVVRVVRLLRERDAQAGLLQAVPEGLEFEFGKQTKVTLGTQQTTFGLQGRVDRIDRSRGAISLIDYKSSKGSSDAGYKAALAGEDLQLPLYARALEQLWGSDAVGLEWITLRTRHRRILHDEQGGAMFMGRAEAVGAKSLPHEAFRDLLALAETRAAGAVDMVRSAQHQKAPRDQKVCLDCPWHTTCRPGASPEAHPDPELRS